MWGPGWTPVSNTLLADHSRLPVQAYIHVSLLRTLTAESFEESWSDVPHEMERLELGRTVEWDSLLWDEDDD